MDALPTSAAEAAGSTLAERALDLILAMIRDGDLAPGSELNEVDLARRFGMSRGPVREAVRRLQGRKLVTREPYVRARVAALGLPELQEIFELRECLEGMSCRLATERLSDDVLKEHLRVLEQHGTDAAPAFDFHVAVAQGSGNARIAELLSVDLYDMVRLYRWRSGTLPGRREDARREHWEIARAMMTRDAVLAESLMRSHIRRAWQNLSADATG
ncbi:GntR family transcriptional regulator [Muricoccus radiodurans]|uniref:GntR family transcriptional regulator n=1 Tax=Muricoccus radiodurans TaxID=2231721 RepID=UPI003CF06FB7